MDGNALATVFTGTTTVITGLIAWGLAGERKSLMAEIAQVKAQVEQEGKALRLEVSNAIMAAEKSIFDRMNGKYVPNMGANLTGPELMRRLARGEKRFDDSEKRIDGLEARVARGHQHVQEIARKVNVRLDVPRPAEQG